MHNAVIALILLWLATPVAAYVLVPKLFYGTKSTRKRIVIMVLGDLSRSPRMCYHALSFALTNLNQDKKGFGMDVEFCGYVENPLPHVIMDQDNINITPLPVIQNSKSFPFLLFGPYKVLLQIWYIAKTLWALRGSDYILLQNPPSIPLLPVVVLYKVFFTLNKTKLIIDWHNFGYTILKMKFNGSESHPFVKIHYWVEYLFAKFGDYHLTVTHSMKDYLTLHWKLDGKKISVLHDRPGMQFKPLKDEKEKKHLIATSGFIKNYFPAFDSQKDKILVTSTSFTPDEDLSILLDSLVKWDRNSSEITLHCFITGKGPLKMFYQDKVASLKLSNVKINFVWLSNEDYPLLLQLCDFGVSLHLSSSGLDLPMKILDMFGSGLPVVAYGYPTLSKELVFEGRNGYTFEDVDSCVECLNKMCDRQCYEALRENVLTESQLRWQTNWENSIIKELKL